MPIFYSVNCRYSSDLSANASYDNKNGVTRELGYISVTGECTVGGASIYVLVLWKKATII